MITATIGRLFLEAYNESKGTQYDAKSFFEKEFYPLFFDHNKYMMTAGNSPLENPKISWGDMIKGKKEWETPEQRKSRKEKLMHKISMGEFDASIARGFPVSDVEGTTSGQVTDMRLPLAEDDIYLSWIGDALGVGVKGGFSILFFDKKILLDIYEGWEQYRQSLENTKKLRGNQINTWNGQWLAHYYNPLEYIASDPRANIRSDVYLSKNDGTMNLNTRTWTEILIAITRTYSDKQVMAYVYNIGQTNTTIGFIPFDLTQIRRPVELYEKFFGVNNAAKAELLWGTGIGFKGACEKGVIGIYAMKPNGIEQYMREGTLPQSANSEEQKINYNVYQIWLLAMLNNDELWEKSQKMADLLMAASTDNNKKISTKSSNLVNDALKAINKKQFIAAITDIIPMVSDTESLVEIVKEVNDMPSDNVPYFLTLVRFQYAIINNYIK